MLRISVEGLVDCYRAFCEKSSAITSDGCDNEESIRSFRQHLKSLLMCDYHCVIIVSSHFLD